MKKQPTCLDHPGAKKHMRVRVSIPPDEIKERIWNLIAKDGLTPEQAQRRVLNRFRPAKSVRLADGWKLQRQKLRITPLEADRRLKVYLRGNYPTATRGGDTGKKLPRHRRMNTREAITYIKAHYSVMGTWEDIQAWGDQNSRYWAPYQWATLPVLNILTRETNR